jgi:hypothetical protein
MIGDRYQGRVGFRRRLWNSVVILERYSVRSLIRMGIISLLVRWIGQSVSALLSYVELAYCEDVGC